MDSNSNNKDNIKRNSSLMHLHIHLYGHVVLLHLINIMKIYPINAEVWSNLLFTLIINMYRISISIQIKLLSKIGIKNYLILFIKKINLFSKLLSKLLILVVIHLLLIFSKTKVTLCYLLDLLVQVKVFNYLKLIFHL